VKFAAAGTAPFRDDLSEVEEDARVARFFELNQQIADAERVAGDPEADPRAIQDAREQSLALRAERQRIENSVELILEGRLTQLIKDAGLVRDVGRGMVWPPVNVEFEEPPAVLVRSPRAEIRRQSDRLLQGDLPIAEREQLESKAEADGETSALVVDIGAIAMYPAIVPPTADYHGTLQTLAHEWVHHYLYFTPLGRSFYDSPKLVTLNETVANMAGAELGDMLFERYPLKKAPVYVSARLSGGSDAPAESDQQTFDFGKEMRALRLEVDARLAAGDIDGAEQLMEERRKAFVANGYYIRKINQAYFAFHGSYADTPASSDTVGPKMQELRDASPTLEAFLETAREFRSEQDLDVALAD
jgi:hypothetical protein